ncbi:MAG: Asd/ArgC dimerization domain-containing protein, partial [Beijerinckiaceae bacterium]
MGAAEQARVKRQAIAGIGGAAVDDLNRDHFAIRVDGDIGGGAGARAINELRDQTDAVARNKPVEKEIFPHQIAFNVIPQVDAFLDSGYTK